MVSPVTLGPMVRQNIMVACDYSAHGGQEARIIEEGSGSQYPIPFKGTSSKT